MKTWKSAVALALAVATLVLTFGFAGDARANGVPQLVKLTYLDGVSNFGPRDADGVLEFSFAEAYARVDVKNLVPAAGTVYQGWMIAPDGSSLLVGEIKPDPAGVGHLDAKLTTLSRYDYALFLITAAPAAVDATAGVPAQKSIAGRFTVVPDGKSSSATGDTVPQALPDTGEKAPMSTRDRVLRTVLVMLGAGGLAGVGLVVVRRRHAS